MTDSGTRTRPVHLAVDLGASSGRVISGGLEGGNLHIEVLHRFANDPVWVHDSMQWNPLGLWSEIQAGLAKAGNLHSDIRSIGVDTWGVDYGLVNSQNQLAGPVRHYRDQRNVGMIEEACQTVSRSEIFQATGLQFMEINTLYQLLAAKKAADPALVDDSDFLMMGDLFHWLLTGERGVEMTNASTTQLLDPRTQTWHEGLIERFGLPRGIFGNLVQPGTHLGNTTEAVARVTGLRDVPVIVPATHDTASAVIAVPARSFAPAKPDWCYISSGTWSLMGCELPRPMINERCQELNFTNEGGVLGSTRLLKNIGGMWVFQQIRAAMLKRGTERTWDDMVSRARAADPFSCLIDPDDPAFAAPDDMVDAIHKRAEDTDQPIPHDEGQLYRSSLEGLALRYRVCLGMLESLVEQPISTIHIVGGGSVNALLCQMTADACNRTVVAGPVEATAIGNVLMQMIGTAQISSIEEARELVCRSFDTKTYHPQDSSAWDEPAKRFALLSKR
ncbi:rhamnulokinase [Rubripirellula amarantea]|nr:rhamnulokinase [Rubripirellula amarantea]